MKVLCIPDPHLKIEVIENGLELAKKLKADRIVLLGDYFDDWFAQDIDYLDMLSYLKDLLFKRRHDVFALMGNHELSYVGYKCSGYKPSVADILKDAITDDFRLLYCVEIDNILYSHAGVTTQWLVDNKIVTQNELRYRLGKKAGAHILEDKVNKAGFEKMSHAGPARGGHMAPSPLWADLTELIADQMPNIKQVVGHTPVTEIQMVGNCWFTDVFSNGNQSDEYLFVVDGKPRVVHYYEEMQDEG